MNIETLQKDLNKNIKLNKLKGVDIVNFFYNNYINFEELDAEETRKVKFLMMSDRHNSNKKSPAKLVKMLIEDRNTLVNI